MASSCTQHGMEFLAGWWRWLGWRRIVVVCVAAPIGAVVVWWMVQLPAPPVDDRIPAAPTGVSPPGTPPGTPSGTPPVSNALPPWLTSLDTVAPPRIAVHVVGAVVHPGVYHLPTGARGDDALRAAGGATGDADVRRVNLAAVLADGEQLVVPRFGERITTTLPRAVDDSGRTGGTNGAGKPPNAESPLMVDLNRATVAELERLPGVGPSTARAIVDHRTRNGPFASVEELLAVRGIGPAKLAELRPFARV